ncbi:MAG: AAA family ATPase, partial [Nitriliruptorales bacterium]|nr:AAA family ATPase [Nitriliruptorales bacterium]
MSRGLIGRRRELGVIARVIDAAASGRGGGTLALAGAAGIGKSRLRHEAERQARERGFLVLSGWAVEEVTEPFRPLTEALAGGFRDTGLPQDTRLVPHRPTLAHVVPAWPEEPAPEVSVTAIAEALLRLLEVAGHGRGALLTIEDAQWADADTVAVVRHLIDHAEAHGALILLTVRSHRPGDALRLVRQFADQRAAVLLELTSLDTGEVEDLVLSCLDQDATSAELLAFIRGHAGGFPFLVEELLAGLVRSGGLVRGDDGWRVIGDRLVSAVPVTLADSVARRFVVLHPRTQEVLFTAALLGQRFDWRLLPHVAGLDEDVVLASLREASDAQLLTGEADRIGFRHALTRDHVAALMLPSERRRLAACAVRAIKQAHPRLSGGWRDLVAELAELGGDRSGAIGHLMVAADRARDRGALATAIARLERAHALARRDPESALAIEQRLAHVRALIGDVDGALGLGIWALRTRAGRDDAPEQEVDLELSLGLATLKARRCEEAREHAARALSRATDLGDGARRARALSLAAQVAMESGDPEDAARLADEALTAAADDLPEVRCEVFDVLGRCARLRNVDRAERAFEAALATANEYGLMRWRARALHELGMLDLLETMRVDRLRAAQRAAVEAGAPETAATADVHLASALVVRDETVSGREAAERAVAVARRLDLAILPLALIVLAASYGHERRRDEMEAVLARAYAASPGDPAVEADAWGHARMMLALHEADLDGTRAALDRAAEFLRRCPDQHFSYWGLRALLCTLADRGGEQARAEAVAVAGRGSGFNRALRCAAQGVAAGRDGDPGRAERDTETAFAIMRRYERCDWLLHTIRWLIAPAALADSWGEPITWLQD